MCSEVTQNTEAIKRQILSVFNIWHFKENETASGRLIRSVDSKVQWDKPEAEWKHVRDWFNNNKMIIITQSGTVWQRKHIKFCHVDMVNIRASVLN